MTREADQLQAQLNQTEGELKKLKEQAGVTSLAESMAATATELTKAETDLDASEAELAAQQARLKEIEKLLAGADVNQADKALNQPGSEVVGEYQALVSRVAQLRQIETELLSRYTAQNRIVKVKRAQIDDLEKQRRNLEKKYPGLVATVSAGASLNGE